MSMALSDNRIESIVYLKISYCGHVQYDGRTAKSSIRSLIEAMEYAADEDLVVFFLYDLNYTNDVLEEIYKIQTSGKTSIPDQIYTKTQAGG